MYSTRRAFQIYNRVLNKLTSSLNHSNINHYLKNKSVPVNHYRRSTPPISVPLNKLFSNNFPLDIGESINDYRRRKDRLSFQHDLLSLLPFYPESDGYRSSEVIQVDIGNSNHINEFVIYSSNEAKNNYDRCNHLIMVHGYGSGLGLFIKNFDEISRLNNWVIHAIDLLGYGCSSRPKFHPSNLSEVESWFHDSFKTWMEKRKIPKDKTLLMAHSMGAYLMASYGFKVDPNFCKKAIIVSPGAIIDHKVKVSIPAYFERLWERNISPFSLVRAAGIWGSKLTSGWSFRRFANLSKQEKILLHRYTYAIFQGPGSGEYMLNYLLKPGANPRHPMISRDIHKTNFDFSWWYGKDDWMNKDGGYICSQKINSYHNGFKSDVMEIENSGHHIYLDNAKKFNNLLLQEMKRF